VGMTTYSPKEGLEIIKGPIFANFIIADEINRSTPKTQSALIEAMQERQVTIGKKTFHLPEPFFVMANQNPIETEGVYSLPEAQMDRFLFKLLIDYPEEEEESRIMEENVTFRKFEDYNLQGIVSPDKIILMQNLVHQIYLDNKIKKYILNIVKKTRSKDFDNGNYIELGASPRASISLYIAAKAEALLKGRNFVIPSDVKKIAKDVLRHRIILSYKARADKITTDKIIDEILKLIVTK
ncbi:MAG: MoxR family ATPase, partial [Nanoarchaeota archaeon]